MSVQELHTAHSSHPAVVVANVVESGLDAVVSDAVVVSAPVAAS